MTPFPPIPTVRFWLSRIQEDLLVVLDPRIRTHGSNLCSLIVAGNRYLFISPLRGLKQRECFWRLRGQYFGHCLGNMSVMMFACSRNTYKEEEEEAEAEAKENGGGDDE